MRQTLNQIRLRLERDIALAQASDDPEATHRLRATLRDARVVCRLAAAFDEKQSERAEKRINRALRATRKLRDTDVLAEWLAAHPIPGASERLEALRLVEQGRARSWWAWNGGMLKDRLAKLSKFEDGAVSSCPLDKWLGKAESRATARVEKRLRKAQRSFSARRAHRLRIAVRDMRILFRLTGHEAGAALKEAQQVLGRYNDSRNARLLLKMLLARNGVVATLPKTVLEEHRRAKANAKTFVSRANHRKLATP